MSNGKYDFAYVMATTGDIDFAFALSKVFGETGGQILFISVNLKDVATLRERGLECVYVGPKGVELNGGGLPSMMVDYIGCERSYFKMPRAWVSAYAEKIYTQVNLLLPSYEIKCFLQSPGGEVIRGVIHEYAARYSIEVCVFGEYIRDIGGSVVYRDDMKSLRVPKKPATLIKDSEVDLGKGVVSYKRDFQSDPESARSKLFAYIAAKDWYALFCAIGYRLGLMWGNLSSFMLRLFSVNKIPSGNGGVKVFVPLNVAAESELFVRNKRFVSVRGVYDEVRKKYPDAQLIFKGHPGSAISFTLLDVIWLRGKGVVILDSQIPATKILSEIDVVCFVSSTVGLEAIRVGVPIACIGHWPYKELAEACGKKVDGGDAILVDKSKFFERLSVFPFDGQSYSSFSELKKLCNSISEEVL
ncbi:capsular polysaccharide export protein, LipB/KpsS family [Brachymonas wangyanguii]|uniref:capsular polysaccharide export protein, LipB/KpsS family n=1 Tax=Brachymonas wangyanguii TaxID=3130163 RepID=UPI00307F8B6A